MSALDGRRAFVTGGSSGIGAATVAALRQAGARVVAPSRRECDVRDERAVTAAVARAASELGGLDVVVPAAGLGRFAPTAEARTEDVDEVMSVNFRGTFLVLREALPHLLASSGHVFVLASVAALRPFPMSAAYCASKAAVRSLAQVVAEEYRHTGLRVTTLVLGSVDTPFWDRAGGTELPRDRMLRTEDVARAIVAAAAAPPRASLDEIVLMPQDGVL
jgi:NAD(P)-dependent dehydrogenase (short-subunit alcohol dehydrogenase family)